MYKNSIIINFPHGIHVRVAAEIVNMSDRLKEKYGIHLFIRKSTEQEPIAFSMLALLSLRIKHNDIIEISCREDTPKGRNAVLELCDFIYTLMNKNNSSMEKIDSIMEEGTLANEQIIQNIPIGVIVVDINSSIVTANRYALKIIKNDIKNIIGKDIKTIIPTSELPSIIESKKPQIGKIKHINDRVVYVNSSPIFSVSKVIGAVEVFQDISELIGMKELNEKFKKILETSHDLICFVDEHRNISYINPSYEENLPKSSKDIIGKDLAEISPNGLRMKVFTSKKKIDNLFCQKEGLEMISTIEPLFIDGTFKGIISMSKPVNQIRSLLKKLEESEEKLNYYKEELLKHTKYKNSFKDIIGSSGSLRECLILAQKASESTSTVLIRGESGTGKELIAEAIHNNSDRSDKPFIKVNCAAIPENLIESELFGYEKGAFTGAIKNKPGKFSMADKGTIFLDEIGDMPKSMQVKLLRVLQEREFESIGGTTVQKVDVRVIAATNRNLEEMIQSGEFRDDLYYRLNVMNIFLPPLRKRREDIILLVEHFIKTISSKLNKPVNGIDKESLIYLQEYNWPGNIRELENVIERAINICDGTSITLRDLPVYITNLTHKNEGLINLVDGELLPLEEYEKELISIAMKKYKSYNQAGKALGLTHRTVALKCKKYGINQVTSDK